MSLRFQISPEARPLFRAEGFDAFDVLMEQDIGRLLSRDKGGQEVRRLAVAGSEIYLKRRGGEPLARLLGMMLYGRLPASGPLREMRMAERLRAAGFAAAKPLAWGEKRRFGLPRSGFLALEGVRGEEVASKFDLSRGTDRLRLMAGLGELVGRLHARGFLHAVRLKDLIATETGMVLIDRETSKPWPRRWFTPRACAKALARSARRVLRDGHRLGPGSCSAFFRGYRKGLEERWRIPARTLAAATLRAFRKEMGVRP